MKRKLLGVGILISLACVLLWAQAGQPRYSPGATLWNHILSATGNLSLSNGANTTTFNQTSNTLWTWANTTAATSSVPQGSPVIDLAGNYWNGSVSAVDSWKIFNSIASGTNGTSVFSIEHIAGTSGSASLTVENAGLDVNGSGTPGTGAFSLNTSGVATKVANATTAGNGLPFIIADVNSTGLTANVSTTNLLASATQGMYAIEVYWVCTTAATSSGTLPSVVVGWTDDSGTTQSTTVAPASSTNAVGSYGRSSGLVLYSGIAQNITYSTTGYASSGATSLTYSLRFRLIAYGT
jgi:hypothetical protein